MKPRRPIRKRALQAAIWAVVLVLTAALIPTLFGRLRSPDRRLKLRSRPAATPVAQTNSHLRLASYNIAHGRGDALDSRNWTGESHAQRQARMDQIAALLREVNADVVVLNEVDFNSSWSHGLNQARYLAEQAGYPFWVEARNLDLRFLHWTWRFGNAVLSRHPIARAEVIDLPGYSAIESLLAGKKRGVLCDIQMGDDTVRLAGVHLCHRSASVRATSAEMLVNLAAASPHSFVVAGDLNSPPPAPAKLAAPGQTRGVIETFDRSGRFTRTQPAPAAMEAMTFHSARPASVIDWILIPHHWQFQNYSVRASELSDHRLVYADAWTSTEKF